MLFKGYEVGAYDAKSAQAPSETEREKGREKGMKVGLYIWDIRKNTFTLYRRDAYNFCYEDGEAFFVKKELSGLVVVGGPLGKEKMLPDFKPGDLPDHRYGGGPRPCKASRDHSGSFPLKTGWGQLAAHWFPDNEKLDWPVRYTPLKGNPVDLPISRRYWGTAIFAPWRDQYFLVESYANGNRMAQSWWLSKSGATEKVVLPQTPYISAAFLPIRPGILMFGGYRPDMKSVVEPYITYLLDAEKKTRVVTSFPVAEKIAISPTGCKGAASVGREGKVCSTGYGLEHLKDLAAGGVGCYTVKVIDFCAGKEEQ